MRKTTLVFIGVIMAVTATTAMAVGKVTVDPNKPGAKIVMVAPEIDLRLDKKVNYEARRKLISVILADLSEMTGVSLRAGYNNMDWQVRDRRMTIFASNTTLKSLMNSISHVMKFKWSKSDQSGTWTYRLYMDRKTLLGAERQALLEEERLCSIEAEQRAKLVDDLTKAAAMSDDDLEKLRNDNPVLYVLARQGWQDLMPDLFRDVPEAEKAWSVGDALTLNAADLPMGAQQAISRTLSRMGDFFAKNIDPDAAPPSDITSQLDKVQVSINRAKSLCGYRGDTFIGDMTVFWPGSGLSTAFMNPDSDVVKNIYRDKIHELDGEPAKQTNEQVIQAVQQQETDFGEPLIEHEDDPALSAKVKLNVGGPRFDDALAAVAKASGFTVVSDSFRTDYSGLDIGKEVPLKDTLDKISSACRYNWDKKGSTLEFRDRDWFRKRNAQIPESWLEPWRKSLDNTGTLDIDQLSQIALLDYEQLRENIAFDEVLGNADLRVLVFSFGHLLKAYGCLSKDQQDAVFSGEGLDLGSVSPSQWTTVSRIFCGNTAFTGDPDAVLRLLGRRESSGKQFKYAFTVVTSTGQPPIKWEFTTPQYDVTNKINSLPLTDVGSRALDVFAEAVKVKLSNAGLWFKLGIVLYDGKYYPQALEAFERVAASENVQPMTQFAAFTWKGHLLDLMNRREDAILAYKDALKIDIDSETMRHDYYGMVIDRKWVEERFKVPFERK